jgi:hypothetical protein
MIKVPMRKAVVMNDSEAINFITPGSALTSLKIDSVVQSN